jgi:hypothetical protein
MKRVEYIQTFYVASDGVIYYQSCVVLFLKPASHIVAQVKCFLQRDRI